MARGIYKVPGVRSSTRRSVHFATHSLPLSLKNKQRFYNFFAEDTAPGSSLTCSVRVPSGRPLKLDLDLHDDLSRKWYYLGYSAYELGTVRLFVKLLESKRCVLDVGANIGYYSLLAATALEGCGEVHAFEPFPKVFEYLARNARLNMFRCLRLNQAAMFDTDGSKELFLPSDLAGTNASLIENFTKQGASVLTQTIRFDSYCRQNNVRRVDLLKLDVEGAEINVLRGAGPLLDRWQPDIICEVLKPYEKHLNDFFSDRPYKKFLITENGLRETAALDAHPQFRDYYLSCAPLCN